MSEAFTSPIDGAPVHHVHETSSTMDDARRLVRAGAPSGAVVVADYQSAGRGRRAGRVWHSRPGESLMFTVALHRPEEPVTRSLVLAVAIAVELEARFGLDVAVKWPNDVLIVRGADGSESGGARKVCGILADYEAGWLYLGAGLNVRQTAFPPELAESATSVRIEAGRLRAAPTGPNVRDRWDDGGWPGLRDALLRGALRRFGELETGWREALSARLWMRGEEVRVALPGGRTVRGTLCDVADDGRLVVRGDRLHRLAAGEVSLTRDAIHE